MRHLPSTPDILRNSASGTILEPGLHAPTSNGCVDYRGSILHNPPLALAITHERAYIWDYTSTTPVTHPRTFDVTQPTKSTHPLPIGALVTHSNTKTIGLLIISASLGKITYWEDIETAESLSLFQQRNTGLEGSLGTLFSGESVLDITSADHAGFIVTLSSGRIAQISLTDPQGKPNITTHFLRSNDAAGGSGIFGSIKSTFGLGAWKRDVVSVHTRPLGARREIQVVAATENAQIQVWDLSWSGQSVYKGSFDFIEMLQRELFKSSDALPVRERPVKVLDVALTPRPARGDELVTSKHDEPLDLMLLVQSEDRRAMGPRYTIVNVIMSGSHARLERIIPIRPETAQAEHHRRPHLLIPKPGHTAYIFSDQQIILTSLTAPLDDGPEAQLMVESHHDPDLFQDTLWLRTAKHFAIEGCCEEDLGGAAACAVFVKGFGLARISSNEPTTPRSRPTIKSKIEQAIFYGTMSDNIFDMSKVAQPDDQYDIEHVEMAALRISNEILRSTTPFIPAATPTTEAHLSLRIKASRALILYLMKHYPSISKATAWKLLTDAEKLQAAHAIWTRYDAQLVSSSKDSPKPILLPLALAKMKKEQKPAQSTKPPQGQDDLDVVRQWFATDVADVGLLRTAVLLSTISIYEKHNHHKDLMRIISEADDIIFSIYDTVFAFRADSAELYGFSYGLLAEGILEEGWETLPEPWTSNHDVFNAYNKFIDVARDYSIHTWEEEEGNVHVQKVVLENTKLVTILCMIYRERIAYISVHYGDRGPQYPEHFREAFSAARSHHLRLLGKIGQDGEGIAVAEKYHDLDTMVELVMNQTTYLAGEMDKVDEVQHDFIQEKMDDLDATVQRYFKDLGEEWANAFFDAHLQNHKSYGLLMEAEKYRAPLTKYLRAEKARGRVGWIHDVLREQDFAGASKALSLLATEQESKIWNKKVELSLGKLASLAVKEEQGSMANGAITSQLERQENDLLIVRIQDTVKASFEPLLYGAVDVEAEVQLVSDAYAVMIRRKTPSFHSHFEIALEDMLKNVVLSPERLIDVLTLMDTAPPGVPESDITGSEFFLALQVLKAARKDLDREKFDVLHKLIWKRCWLSDDWEVINNTKRKSDKFVSAQLRDSMVCKTIALGLKECKCYFSSLSLSL